MSRRGDWRRTAPICRVETPWLNLVGERWQAEGELLDYWRIEHADSVIVIPEAEGRYWFPADEFRPGVGRRTLDFPGGRLPQGDAPEATAMTVLTRELAIDPSTVTMLVPINPRPYLVNSSTSDQRLFGFHARLETPPSAESGGIVSFATEGPDYAELLGRLECLQCRALMLELRAGAGTAGPGTQQTR